MPHVRRIWNRLDGSVRARVFVPCAIGFALVLILGPILLVEWYGSELESLLLQRVDAFSRMVIDDVTTGAAGHGATAVEKILGARTDIDGSLLSVSLIGLDGRVAFSSDRSEIGTRPWPALPTDQVSYRPLMNRQRSAIRPIVNQAPCGGCHGDRSPLNGWLEVRFSTAHNDAAKRRLATKAALASAGSLVVILAICWGLLGREVVRPLRRLVQAMKRAEGGDVKVIADEGRPDELGIAARGFDATLAALHRSTQELEKIHGEQLVRADRFAAVGEMATGLAHEIRNPLAGLSGALELLAEDFAQSPTQAEMVAEMRHQVQRLTTTMESLLRLARPPRARKRSMDVNEVLTNVLFLVGQQRKGGPLKLERILGPHLPPVHGDPSQIEQVFLNLCLNAHQAMAPAGGTVTVSSVERNGYVVVQVADTGPGIPAEARPHIFTPFFTTRRDGNGLGLAISARIVAEHLGRIEFACPRGEGTVFTVSLPVESAAHAAETLREQAA